MATLYDDLPIESGEFRLLRLKPASGFNQPLVVSLYTQRISSSKNCYDAISYSWGDPRSKYTISVNGMERSVTRSLYSALQYLRHALLERIVWIDGLCINQEDVLERNHQVEEMGRIYSHASCVRIWLGEATDDVEAAMNLITAARTWPRLDNRQMVERVKSDKFGVSALTKLLNRPYWQRMWGFQEIVLAQRAEVHCGKFSADWSAFLEMDQLIAKQSLWITVSPDEEWVHNLRRAFFGIAQFCIGEYESQNMDNVLYPTRGLKCTDSRDKLYALMGVCEMSGSPRLVPDYSRAVSYVYTDFTRCMIDREQDLSCILTAGLWDPLNGPDISIPTWVPDYRGTHGVDIRYLAASYFEHFNATGPKAKAHTFLYDEQGELTRLKVHGKILAKVDKTILSKGDETRKVVKKLIMEQNSGPSRPPSADIISMDDIFRTMIFEDPTLFTHLNRDRLARLALGFAYDILESSDPSSDSCTTKNISTLVDGFLTSFQSRFESHPQEALNEIYARYMKEDLEQLPEYRAEYLARSREVSQGSTSSIFSTQSSLLGKGLHRVAPGDRIAVIFGCRIPVVLRPFGKFYHLVGPCYVNGIMNGEALGQFDLLHGPFEQDIIIV